MSEIDFAKNYNDQSIQSGVNAGFQFEFYCESCSDTYRTEFLPFRTAQASGWLGRAAGILGGVFSEVESAADGLATSKWGTEHDAAFKKALESVASRYHRCARCKQYVCAKCWNKGKGLCRNCAPSAKIEVEAALAEGEVMGAREVATAEGVARGQKIDIKRERQLVCPDCGAETKGAKFCPECGKQMAVKETCPKCNAQVEPGTKFCPECGQKMGATNCPKCKAELKAGAKFCPECGKKVGNGS